MEDWAEVHRLFHREGRAKAAIARQLAMSRNTVERLLSRRDKLKLDVGRRITNLQAKLREAHDLLAYEAMHDPLTAA